ncbi:type II toxin-antitoxin system RelE/ParE family toxin [Mediterranea massiliensis]|uniref:type II toxin-antitoxin system RelE/ParE family toxin n=1 Tax=Mediterranea massiliensis TaxID=1841865 RepID=UPI0023F3C580|nr:type II toxin-antitoxin system RelE/ParE family toxin [Mediterranea massiliensis]
MGRWRVIWNKRAQERFEQIASWYTLNMGPQSAKEFAKDVYDVLNTLSHSPLIGTVDQRRSTENRKYYSFLVHPKYRVIYRLTSTTLYVITFRSTVMKPE